MLKISVDDDDLVDKVKKDPDFRKKFILNAKKLMDDLGVSVSEDDLKEAISSGGVVAGVGVASTNTNVNVFAT